MDWQTARNVKTRIFFVELNASIRVEQRTFLIHLPKRPSKGWIIAVPNNPHSAVADAEKIVASNVEFVERADGTLRFGNVGCGSLVNHNTAGIVPMLIFVVLKGALQQGVCARLIHSWLPVHFVTFNDSALNQKTMASFIKYLSDRSVEAAFVEWLIETNPNEARLRLRLIAHQPPGVAASLVVERHKEIPGARCLVL